MVGCRYVEYAGSVTLTDNQLKEFKEFGDRLSCTINCKINLLQNDIAHLLRSKNPPPFIHTPTPLTKRKFDKNVKPKSTSSNRKFYR